MAKLDLRPYGLFWDLDPNTMKHPVPEAFKVARALIRNERSLYIYDETDEMNMRIVLKDVLGTGTYGTTYSTDTEIDGVEVVVKVIQHDASYTTEDVATEVISQILVVNATADFVDAKHALKGPFAPRVFKFAKDEYYYYIVNEKMAVDFKNILKIDSSLNLKNGISQICIALKVLYDRLQFNHRDFKPDNIMFSYAGNVRLIDYGFCCLKYGQMSISSGYEYPKVSLKYCDKRSRDLNALFFYILNYSMYSNIVCPFKRIMKALMYDNKSDPVNWTASYVKYNLRSELVNLYPENVLKVFDGLEFHNMKRTCSDFKPEWTKNIEMVNKGVIENLKDEEIDFLNKDKLRVFLTDDKSIILTKKVMRSVSDPILKDFCYNLLKELNKNNDPIEIKNDRATPLAKKQKPESLDKKVFSHIKNGLGGFRKQTRKVRNKTKK